MNKPSNGYNKSLFKTEDGLCYITGERCDTARHEIFNGAYRKLSKHDGLWIAVSPMAHELIHKSKGKGSLWNELQKDAELLWLIQDNSRSIDDFIKRYGKNYLTDSDI